MQIIHLLGLSFVSAIAIPRQHEPGTPAEDTTQNGATAQVNGGQEKRQPTFGFMAAAESSHDMKPDAILEHWLASWRAMHVLPTATLPGSAPGGSPSSMPSMRLPALPKMPASPATPTKPAPSAGPFKNGTAAGTPKLVPLPKPKPPKSDTPSTPESTIGSDDTPADNEVPVSTVSNEKRQLPGQTPQPLQAIPGKFQLPGTPIPIPSVHNGITVSSKFKRQAVIPTAKPTATDVGTGKFVASIGNGLNQLLPGPLGTGLESLLTGVGSDIASGTKPPPKKQSAKSTPVVAPPVAPFKRDTSEYDAKSTATELGTGTFVANIGKGLADLLPGSLGQGLKDLLEGVGTDIKSGKLPSWNEEHEHAEPADKSKRQLPTPGAKPTGTEVGAGKLVTEVGTGLGRLLHGPLGGGLQGLLAGVGGDISAGKKPPPRLQQTQAVKPKQSAPSVPAMGGQPKVPGHANAPKFPAPGAAFPALGTPLINP